MGWLSRVAGSLWGRSRVEKNLREELQFHIEERTRENIAAGMPPDSARRDALQRFGNPARLREETRDRDVMGWLDALMREAAQAFRSLLRRPGITVTAILSLTLGIGATSAMFSVVDAVLLKPLALPDPKSLVRLDEVKAGESVGNGPARLKDWQDQTTSFRSLAGFYGSGETLTGRGPPERLQALRTFGPLIATLGVRPARGRGFTHDEEEGRGAPVLMLSDRFRRRLGGGDDWVGRTLTLSGVIFTIVGVLPPEFDYPPDVDVVAPAPLEFHQMDRHARFLSVVGRLKDGTTLRAAEAETQTIAQRLGIQYPATDSAIRVTLLPLQAAQTGWARQPLLLLLGAVMLVLLIACVNIASLLLARAAERRHEAAIRVSLGAGRWSLVRMYLLEGAWLALAGGTAGLMMAWAGVPLLRQILPADLPRLASATLDWRVAAFAALIAVGSGLVFAVAPALQGTRSAGHQEAIRDGGRTTASSGRLRTRRVLVVAQVTLSMVLLVGASLLARSFYLMRQSPSGVEPEQVLAIRAPLTWEIHLAEKDRFYARSLAALGEIPGVRVAGLVDRLPLEGETQRREVRILEDASLAQPVEGRSFSYRATSPGYFEVMGVPILRGRLWRERNGEAGPRELVVNATFALRYLPADHPLGAHVTFDTDPKALTAPRWYEIVGVVGDVRQSAKQAEQPPELFVPYQDTYWPLAVFVIRGLGSPAALGAQARRAIGSVDPTRVIDAVRPLTQELSLVTEDSRTRTVLVGLFAVTAVSLAAIGLYGVLSSEVTQRRQEIGVRIALGARPAQVLRMVVLGGVTLTLGGLVLGAAGALALGKVLATQLYGVGVTDLVSFGTAAGALLGMAFAASCIPGRRAARLDPMTALRRE